MEEQQLYAKVIERFTKLGLAARTKDGEGKERDVITLPTFIPKGEVGVGIGALPARGAVCDEEGCALEHRDRAGDTAVLVVGASTRLDELRHLARAAEIASADDDDFEARLLTFTASDETIDRYGDRILVDGEYSGKRYGKGWQFRDFQKKNPVFMPFHSYREIPLGVALDTWTDSKGERKRLRMTVLMDNGEANTLAPKVLKAYQSRLMRSVSVGFLPMPGGVCVPADDVERKAWGLGPEGYMFATQELLENSAVAIPANPNARLEGLTATDTVRFMRFASEVREVAPELAYQIRHALTTGAGLVDLATKRGADDLTDNDDVREDHPQNPPSDASDLSRALAALHVKVDGVVKRLDAIVARDAEGAGGEGASGSGRDAGDPIDSDLYEPLIRGFDELGNAARR